ncbi:MAG: class I SAM-dependent methyltransferase [Nitrospirales bacterium]
MNEPPHLWDSGERVPPESHNTLYQELFSAYKAARNVSQKGLVLDVGCGAGYGANYLAEAGCRVVGIDYEPAVARAAACRYRRRGLHFSCMDGSRLGLRSGSVDVACAFQVLEHFSEPEQFLTELARVLRPDGLVILSTPNALTHVGSANPFHKHEFTPEELKTLLRRHFACVLLAGQHRPSDVYLLERACQQVRRWDVVGIKRILPRKLISLLVYLIARWNHLPPPQGMGLQTFPITPDTDKAYSIFAMCGHSPLPELGFQQTGTP